MDRAVVIGAGLLLGGFAVWAASQADQVADAETSPDLSLFDETMSQIQNFTIPVADVLNDPQVQAFLWLIRTGEGTTGPNGYRTLFGGSLFSSFADHPRQSITRSGITSTAAGAYQFLSRTWDEMAAMYGLADFTPANQDFAAVGLIKRRGALADVMAGRFRAAIDKCNKEWASLPGSPYGQPTLTYDRAASVLAGAGANFAGAIA
jgi:lysozyme